MQDREPTVETSGLPMVAAPVDAVGQPEPTLENYGLPRRWITTFLLCLAAAFAVLVFTSSNDKGAIAACSMSAAVLAVLWPLVPTAESLKVGTKGFEIVTRVRDVERKASSADNKADEALATLSRFVFNSMPQPAFQNLEDRHALRIVRHDG